MKQLQLTKVFSKSVFVANNKESLLAQNTRLQNEVDRLKRVISSYQGSLTRQNNKR